MRILCTDDDGVASAGLEVLADAVRREGHDVVVVAPRVDMSGTGAALGPLRLDGYVDVVRGSTPGGVPTFGIDGPPALAVLAAHDGAFGPRPELVIAGVNAGQNTGAQVLHSGTVGAALTAAQFAVPAMAVSVAGGEPWAFETAAAVAVGWIDHTASIEPGLVLNLNVPGVELDDIRGVRWADLHRAGAVQVALAGGPALQLELSLRDDGPAAAGTDAGVLSEGYVAVTLLRGITACEPSAGGPTDVAARP
jgi:5'-nucleotidase